MDVRRVDNDNWGNTCAYCSHPISFPEVGHWVTLEGHQKEVISGQSTEGDDHCPDDQNLRSKDAYLFEKRPNINLQQASGKDVANLSPVPPLVNIRIFGLCRYI